MAPEAGSIVVKMLATEELSGDQRSSIIDVCIAAHDNEDFKNLFTIFIPSGGRHFLAYLGVELVSHAVVTTRWAQPEGQRELKTAYVDAVSTLPQFQSRGCASAVIRRLAADIGDYESRVWRLSGTGSTSGWGGKSGAVRWPGGASTD